MSRCNLCPRRCNADRENGEKGFCRMGRTLRVARAALHMWEEPCISGTNGSGTVFFSGCTLQCVYCQNSEIAIGCNGAQISENDLADIFIDLQRRGAHNINLVTPTQFADSIIRALDIAKPRLNIPVVYNSGGYENVETVRMLGDYVDIWLPDFKYFYPETAKKYSHAPDYPETAKAAIGEMVRLKPKAVISDGGIMQSGVIVRHLLLPGNLSNSKKCVEYIYKTFGDSVCISIMGQYTPAVHSDKYPELNEKASRREYEKLIDYALSLEVTNAYIQESGSDSAAFIPKFGKNEIIF